MTIVRSARSETGGRVALPVFRELMLKMYGDELAGPVPVFPDQMEQRITRYLDGDTPALSVVHAPTYVQSGTAGCRPMGQRCRRGQSMYIRTTAALMMAAGLISTTAVAQPAPNPTQQPNPAASGTGAGLPGHRRRPDHSCHQLSAAERRDEGRLRRDALAAERRRHGAGRRQEGLHRHRRAIRQTGTGHQIRSGISHLRALGDHARGARDQPR